MPAHRSCRLLALLLALTVVGCEPDQQPKPAAAPEQDSAEPTMVLKTYTVPNGYGQKVRSVLRFVLSEGEQPVGRVGLAPNGQLLVVAPASIQDGVQGILEELERSGVASPVPPTIEITYWLVVGKPIGKKEGRSIMSRPPSLQAPDLGDVLLTIADSQGPMAFTLLERIVLQSLDSERATVLGRTARVGQTVSVSGEKILVDVNISIDQLRGFERRIDTRLQFTPDQTVVMGQVGFIRDDPGTSLDHGPPSDEDAMLFFVVRASIKR